MFMFPDTIRAHLTPTSTRAPTSTVVLMRRTREGLGLGLKANGEHGCRHVGLRAQDVHRARLAVWVGPAFVILIAVDLSGRVRFDAEFAGEKTELFAEGACADLERREVVSTRPSSEHI